MRSLRVAFVKYMWRACICVVFAWQVMLNHKRCDKNTVVHKSWTPKCALNMFERAKMCNHAPASSVWHSSGNIFVEIGWSLSQGHGWDVIVTPLFLWVMSARSLLCCPTATVMLPRNAKCDIKTEVLTCVDTQSTCRICRIQSTLQDLQLNVCWSLPGFSSKKLQQQNCLNVSAATWQTVCAK